MSISQPPFQSTLVDANDRVQTPWAQWFSQLQPILQSVVASGPTSGRPTQNLYIGYPYFDTTIDQMVYWNGVIWVTYAPSTTGTSILKGNGSGGFNNAIAGVDFAPATSGNAILYGDGAGGFSSVSIGSGVTFAGGVLSATGSGGTVTAVTGTAPIASSGGTTPAISISQAGTATDGYLSSIDWNTFNNKGSGTVTAVTGSGNIASSGGTTPNITFTGTLPIANGGTNGTATPTAGAVAVGNGTQYAFTAAGSAGQVLTSNGSTVPTWATVATGIGTTGYWGSFWDTTNQTAASTTVAYTINIGTSDPNNNGVSIASSNRITVAYAGVYNIQYSIQFENIGTGNKNYNVDVWFRLNGVDISDSNSTYWIASKNSTVNGELIAAVNYVLSLAAGDYIQLMWAVSDVDISIATLPATSSPSVPRTPGIIVTVTPITEVGIGYYNLTSVSSVAIATGSKTFTTNLSNISTAFTVGTRVRVAYVTTPANYMEGVITSFSGTTLVVNVDSIGGSGTYANWTISVAGIQGSNGVTSITGTANQVIASASTGAVTLSLPQSINSGAAPTFLGTNFTGTASININGTVGATTTNTGAFTTLSYTSSLTGGTGVIAIGTNQIYKDASGNVGIGTSSPASYGNLAIVTTTGTTNVADMYFANLNIVSNTTVGYPALGYNIASGGALNTWNFLGGDNAAWIQYQGNKFNFYRNSNTPVAGTAITPALSMLIDASGNVSIPAGQLTITNANNTATGGGQIYLNGVTGNRIDFNTAGVAAPAFTTRSVGTKIVLYPGVAAAAVDYAVGMESNTLWTSVPSTAQMFKWYGGTTLVATLLGTGNLNLVGNVGVGGATASTSGTGITFPATQAASSDANTLDDYEEGVWTPVLTSGFTTTGTVTRSGYYTKVGRVVTVSFVIQATSVSPANAAVMSGLPFPATQYGIGLSTNIGGTATAMSITTITSTLVFGGVSISTPNLIGSVTYSTT